jgi:hypothetical protein
MELAKLKAGTPTSINVRFLTPSKANSTLPGRRQGGGRARVVARVRRVISRAARARPVAKTSIDPEKNTNGKKN